MAGIDFTILGGSGFIGGALAGYLRQNGDNVRTPGREEIARGALDGADLGNVVYAIGLTADFRKRLGDTVEAHVCLLSRLLEKTRWTSWLFLSSTRVYGAQDKGAPRREEEAIALTPSLDSVYDLSKLLGEAMCLARPEKTCRVARLSNVFGSGMAEGNFLASIIADAARSGQVTINEDRASAKDYVPIDEVVRLLCSIATEGENRSYNVASGVSLSHGDMAEILVQTLDAKVAFRENAPLRRLPDIDVSRIRAEFGGPQIEIDAAIRRLVREFETAKG